MNEQSFLGKSSGCGIGGIQFYYLGSLLATV